MNWLDKLEKKLGRYAIPNLTVYLLAGYIIGVGVYKIAPSLLNWLTLEPIYIMRGQVWRIISWVLIPPTGDLFSLLILVLLYYSLGTALERTWGTFRYNVYIFSGILFTVIAVFVLYGIFYLVYGVEIPVSSFGLVSTNYINMSIFLAFATIYPDMEVMLYFILPIKMKWMGLVYAVMVLYNFFTGGIVTKVIIGASLLNFVIFFWEDIKSILGIQSRQRSRQTIQFKSAVRQQKKAETERGYRHKCEVCGRTDADHPELEFRYCSKCQGYHCFCSDHIFNHQHFAK